MRKKITSAFRRVQKWYGRFERPISSLSLIGGFVFDAVTLRRVDMFWENFWLAAHIGIVVVCMIWINANENKKGDEKNPATLHFWLLNILQFFFGGLLSTLLVFYFRSATLAVSWPFIAILVIAFWANESLKHHFSRLTFQVSLLFLSVYLSVIFLVPVIIHQLGPSIFILSGVISLILIGLFLRLLLVVSKEEFHRSKRAVFAIIFSITAVLNILYFTHLIPPLPLSLKDAGVYHDISRNTSGQYEAASENVGWQQKLFSYFAISQTIHIVPGESVYVYSAIFSPSQLNVLVVHEWQYLDVQTGKWITSGVIDLPVVGGRDGGFRTYSMQSGLAAGKWRVNVKTSTGDVLGRLRFDIVAVDSDPELVSEIKN